MRVAFDVGGVVSKYPNTFRALIRKFTLPEVYIISDMHPEEKIINLLQLNDIDFWQPNVHSANYDKYGEACKSVLLDELNIDLFFDDFIGYVALPGKYPTIRCLVMPDAELPYYADSWKMPEGEPVFGRRTYKKST